MHKRQAFCIGCPDLCSPLLQRLTCLTYDWFHDRIASMFQLSTPQTLQQTSAFAAVFVLVQSNVCCQSVRHMFTSGNLVLVPAMRWAPLRLLLFVHTDRCCGMGIGVAVVCCFQGKIESLSACINRCFKTVWAHLADEKVELDSRTIAPHGMTEAEMLAEEVPRCWEGLAAHVTVESSVTTTRSNAWKEHAQHVLNTVCLIRMLQSYKNDCLLFVMQ